MEQLHTGDPNFGKKGRDIITKFEGIITCKISYLTGCDQYGLTPDFIFEGKPIETNYFDVTRIKIIGNGINKNKEKVGKPTVKGGPSFKPKSTNGRK